MAKKTYTRAELGDNEIQASKTIYSKSRLIHNRELQCEIDANVKVYTSAFNRDRRCALGYRALQLLNWCEIECNERADYVTVNVKLFMAKCKITSVNTYKAALIELIEANILAETKVKNVFYFDHSLFFKGSRINAIENAIVLPVY